MDSTLPIVSTQNLIEGSFNFAFALTNCSHVLLKEKQEARLIKPVHIIHSSDSMYFDEKFNEQVNLCSLFCLCPLLVGFGV